MIKKATESSYVAQAQNYLHASVLLVVLRLFINLYMKSHLKEMYANLIHVATFSASL